MITHKSCTKLCFAKWDVCVISLFANLITCMLIYIRMYIHMNYLLYKAEKPSVRLHFLSRDNLDCLCMDRRETWFVYSCGLWHVNAPLNNFLTVLCWAHERFKETMYLNLKLIGAVVWNRCFLLETIA